MEPTQTSIKPKVPTYGRAVSWLGGASFGRSLRRETPPTPHATYGTVPLILLDAALVGTFALRTTIGPWVCISAAILITVLSAMWLRRFHDQTLPYFRWAACAVMTIQLLLFLPIYILTLLHSPIKSFL